MSDDNVTPRAGYRAPEAIDEIRLLRARIDEPHGLEGHFAGLACGQTG
jgi:hypothetical protein